MITEIGIVAGEIWNSLEKLGEVSFDELIKEIKRPKDIICMSLGWLAREGHVLLKKDGDDYKIRLR
ncbi:MAG: hypothetical protein B1H08_00890 [Candidatus Omnitrophica bacterium 4484_171]|nr:MAG: hypothetical protein B1H08_00890 [Candidatus Omnitrophica bacterium 4484_171]